MRHHSATRHCAFFYLKDESVQIHPADDSHKMKRLRDHNLAASDLNSTFTSLQEAIQHTSELLIQIPENLNLSGVISPEVASRY